VYYKHDYFLELRAWNVSYLAIMSCGFLVLHTPLFSSKVRITEYERDLERLNALAVRLDITDLQIWTFYINLTHE